MHDRTQRFSLAGMSPPRKTYSGRDPYWPCMYPPRMQAVPRYQEGSNFPAGIDCTRPLSSALTGRSTYLQGTVLGASEARGEHRSGAEYKVSL